MDIEQLERVAREKMRALGCVSKGGKKLAYSEAMSFHLGCVTYEGQGVYKPSDRVVPWEQVPEGDAQGSVGDMAFEVDAAWWPVIHIAEDGEIWVGVGGWVIVVCIYQWMWDMPVAYICLSAGVSSATGRYKPPGP